MLRVTELVCTIIIALKIHEFLWGPEVVHAHATYSMMLAQGQRELRKTLPKPGYHAYIGFEEGSKSIKVLYQ